MLRRRVALAALVALLVARCTSYDHAAYDRLLDAAAPDIAPAPDSACGPGLAACNGACVDTAGDPSNCGGCGIPCPGVINGQPGCAAGTCTMNCAADHHACGPVCVANADVETCGGACTPCDPRAHAVASCDGTACHYACEPGFDDCNGDRDATGASNGCEADLSQAAHCGACMSACTTGSATLCSQVGTVYTCTAGCATGQRLCGTSCADVTRDVTHCGSCAACASPPRATPTCTASVCGFVCSPGHGDCNASATDGCETTLANDVAHCGACDTPCAPVADGTVACSASSCVPTCNPGYVAQGGRCLDFGGPFVVDSTEPCAGSTCVTADPLAAACACPAGFVTSRVDAHTTCRGVSDSGEFGFCQPPVLASTGSWAGAYLAIAPSSSCVPGACLTPNGATGGCSCPAGTTSIVLNTHSLATACSSTVVVTNIVLCARAPAAGAGFGGAYEQYTDAGTAPTCLVPNPWTGLCTCPPTQPRAVSLPTAGFITAPMGTVSRNSTTVFCLPM